MAPDSGDDAHAAPTAGEEAAAQERSFWETRREVADLDDDEKGRRERRRLTKRSRRMNLQVRMHRYGRQVGDGPLPGDLRLPPLPTHCDSEEEDEAGRGT